MFSELSCDRIQPHFQFIYHKFISVTARITGNHIKGLRLGLNRYFNVFNI